MVNEVDYAMKFPKESLESSYRVDVVEECANEEVQHNGAISILESSISTHIALEEAEEVMEAKAAIPIMSGGKKLKPSIVEPPVLELKPLPSYFQYAFLGENKTLPVVISSSLDSCQEEKLLDVLRTFKEAIGWTIADIKGNKPHHLHA